MVDDDVAEAVTQPVQVDGLSAAAILMMLLSEDEAAAIMRGLDPDTIRTLGQTMFRMADADETLVEAALDMFVTRCRSVPAMSVGAEDRIRGVITQAVGNVRADNILSEIAPRDSKAALDIIRWMDAADIARILATEHRQVGALILAVLTSDVAAQALANFPEQEQAELLARAARLTSVSRDAIASLEDVLTRAVPAAKQAPSLKLAGKSEAAKIVNKMKKADGLRIIKSLKKIDRALGQEIEDEMFVFENLAELDDKALGAVLRAVDGAVLSLALKGAPADLAERMLGCLSARAAQSIRDEMEESGPVKRSDVEDAQKQVVVITRQLADDGTIMLGGGDNDYV